MQSLLDAGLPLVGLAEAIRAGYLDLGFVDAPAYERFAGLTDMTFRDAAATFGVPIEIVLAIREGSGSAAATAEDRMRPSETEVLPALAMELLGTACARQSWSGPSGRSARACVGWPRSRPTGG